MSRVIPKPTGSRRALTQKAIVEIFSHWFEVMDEKTGKTRGQATLDYLFHSEPLDYARLMTSLIPKELIVENNLDSIPDSDIDQMIERIRQRLEDERATKQIEARRQLEHAGTRSGAEQVRGGEEPENSGKAAQGAGDHLDRDG